MPKGIRADGKRSLLLGRTQYSLPYIAKQYLVGRTQADIARELGCNRITVLKYLKRLGIPSRHSFFGPSNAMYGKHLSDSHKTKLSLMHKRNIETKEK